jgi:hypothetical protein
MRVPVMGEAIEEAIGSGVGAVPGASPHCRARREQHEEIEVVLAVEQAMKRPALDDLRSHGRAQQLLVRLRKRPHLAGCGRVHDAAHG